MRVDGASERRITEPREFTLLRVDVPSEERTEDERLERLLPTTSERSMMEEELRTDEAPLLELRITLVLRFELRRLISVPPTEDLLERPFTLRPIAERPFGMCW